MLRPLPKSKNSQLHEYYINEAGLYELTFGSTLPEAKAFKQHVCSVILPEIRKTGGYKMKKQLEDKDKHHQLAVEEHRRALQQKSSHINLITLLETRGREIENLIRNRHVPLTGR